MVRLTFITVNTMHFTEHPSLPENRVTELKKDISICFHRYLSCYNFFAIGAIAIPGAYFGPGMGPILLGNVECTGDEQRLTACPSQRIGRHGCQHSEDASVICLGMHLKGKP